MRGSYIGEIVRAHTSEFSAVVPPALLEQGNLPVCLGTLVKVQTARAAVYGIVSFIEHAPFDSSRKILPHGKSRDELRKEMPQVFELLQTEFTAIAVGVETAEGKLVQTVPPTPPDLHDFVYATSSHDLARFLERAPTFLRLVLQSRSTVSDEIIVAFFRNYQAQMSRQCLVKLGKELSYLLSDDYRRLESILMRIYD
ncbi:MAG: hypothetical protein RMI34_00280 [Chloroherpetonaceae bacterium]|nr:hypothetical protein [Chloroherpetonaceae bacterium]MCS7210994.1 hypothetical protein [Chloroherpetonaceae bacterium]MDW8018496.1 hypothetical protein [Chloroherpetonaceae bacterium]